MGENEKGLSVAFLAQDCARVHHRSAILFGPEPRRDFVCKATPSGMSAGWKFVLDAVAGAVVI